MPYKDKVRIIYPARYKEKALHPIVVRHRGLSRRLIKAALQRAMGHSIGSAVTDDYYIDQDAHVKKAAIEFSKLAAELESVTKIVTNGH